MKIRFNKPTALTAANYGKFVIKYRWITIVAILLMVVALSAGGRLLTISNDSRIYFSEDNPQLIAFEAIEKTYSEANTVLIGLAATEGSVFQIDTLTAIQTLTEQGWQIPYASRVDSLTNFSHSWAEGDELIVNDLVPETKSLSSSDLNYIKDVALSSPGLVNRLVAEDGNAAGVLINFVLPEDQDKAVPEIMGAVWNMLDKARANHPNIEFHPTGSVVMSQAFGDAAINDLTELGPIIIAAIVIVMMILLRSVWGTIGTLLVVLFAGLSGMGAAGWAGFVLSPGSAGAPTIIMTVAIAHSVHIIWSTIQSMRRGKQKNEAIVESLRINLNPIFLTSITTAIGFLSMNASDSPPFNALGNIVAIGVFGAFIFSVTFLPALLSLLPLKVRLLEKNENEFFSHFGAFVVKRKKPLFFFVGAIIIGLATGIPQVELNDNWTEYFSKNYEFRKDTDFVIENLSGVEYFDYSLESGEEGGITNPAYLSKVDEFAEWYRSQPKIVNVAALPDIMKRLNKNMHQDDPEWHRIPESSELAAQYLLLYELSLPLGRDLNDQINVSKSATRMTVVAKDLSAKEQRQMDEKAVAWLKENAPPSMHTKGSGLSVMFAHISQRNIEGMLTGTIIAMGLISLILVFALRSLRLGVISLIPNFVPAAMAFGLWGYTLGNIGVAATVVTAVTFGIVVDDTIHFLSKYLRGRREEKLGPEMAVRYAFNSVGHALWTTTAVLGAGFAVLATSGFEINWNMGLLTCITIVLALVADFFFLPPLMIYLDRRKQK
tara:strand:+ start:27376 stop:29697 length:2322 start_codon:yes stop_codon:yes gene_type:complete